MKIAARPGNFGEPPKPKLEFLRLRSPPPKVKEADIREVAKYAPGDQVVWDSKQFPGLAGLRSAEVREVDFANPNYAPLPRSNEPEPIYLIKLDSNPTTYARTSPRWVRETQIHPRPCGVQWDAWQKARLKWDHVWDQDKEFELLAEKQTEAHVKRTLDKARRKLLQSLSATSLLALPVSRMARLDESDMQEMATKGISPNVQRVLGLKPADSDDLPRSVSMSSLLHSRRPIAKLEPLPRQESPQRRHRVQGSLRQRRVRNQIKPTAERPPVVDSRKQSPWYLESSPADSRPPFLQRQKMGGVITSMSMENLPPIADQLYTKRADHAQQNLLIIP